MSFVSLCTDSYRFSANASKISLRDLACIFAHYIPVAKNNMLLLYHILRQRRRKYCKLPMYTNVYTQLAYHICVGDLPSIKRLVQKYPTIDLNCAIIYPLNVVDLNTLLDKRLGRIEYTPLRLATYYKHAHIVYYLLARGIRLGIMTVPFPRKNVAICEESLFIAACFGQLTIIKLLYRIGVRDQYHEAVDYAARSGNLRIIKYMIRQYGCCDTMPGSLSDRILQGILYGAIKGGHLWLCRWAYKRGADIRMTGNMRHPEPEFDDYPLYLAALHGQYHIIRWLRQNGAVFGMNPIIGIYRKSLIHESDICMIQWLLSDESGCGISITHTFTEACEQGCVGVARFLLKKYGSETCLGGMDDAAGKILCTAIQYGQCEIIKLLFQYSINPCIVRKNCINDALLVDETALTYAIRLGNRPVIKCLIEECGMTCDDAVLEYARQMSFNSYRDNAGMTDQLNYHEIYQYLSLVLREETLGVRAIRRIAPTSVINEFDH